MLTPRLAVSCILLGLLLIVAACSESPTAPPAPPSPSFATDAYCALYPDYCTPSTPDPALAAPGYYAGPELTDTYCSGDAGGINDVDTDLLADDCELWLALKFAPKMLYDRADDVRRQSYWAVAPGAKTGFVRVFYALGYFFDLGTTMDCGINLAVCGGHSGDSEHVILDLLYNRTTKHWVLRSAKLSAHTGYNSLPASSAGYASATYPDRDGGYPLVFVSRQKHTNYPTRQACNDGAALNNDDCGSNDQSFRPDVIANRNLGRYGKRLIDKVASTYSFYQSPARYEWMWSSAFFYGWQLDHSTHATGYGEHLLNNGF